MKFRKKTQREEKTLNPVKYVIESLQEYRNALVQNEVDSLNELNMVRRSFGEVLKDSEELKDSLSDFEQTFSSINTVSGQFASVKDNIFQSVDHVQGEVETLKNSSLQVAGHFGEMQNTFDTFQLSLNEIRKCMVKIVSIADQHSLPQRFHRSRQSRGAGQGLCHRSRRDQKSVRGNKKPRGNGGFQHRRCGARNGTAERQYQYLSSGAGGKPHKSRRNLRHVYTDHTGSGRIGNGAVADISCNRRFQK